MPIPVLPDIYLYRSSNGERNFIPEEANKDPSLSYHEWADYVPLGEDQDLKTKKSHETLRHNKRYATMNTKYIPLKIKRLQGNSNRIKATRALKLNNTLT